MSGTMSMPDLVEDLKASLFDAARVFTGEDDADFKRFLAEALPDMQVKRPSTRLASVELVAGVDQYAVAAPDFHALKLDLWRDPGKLPPPWEPTYPGALPRVADAWDGAAPVLVFQPAPTAAHLAALGSTFRFYYFARLAVGEDAQDTTVAAADRGLLLLRAQAAAMLALAVRAAGKPVQLRDGLSGTPRNSTPTALHQVLMQLFWEAR